jgi:hypothetical protein
MPSKNESPIASLPNQKQEKLAPKLVPRRVGKEEKAYKKKKKNTKASQWCTMKKQNKELQRKLMQK